LTETVQWYCEKLGYEIDYNAAEEYASLHHKVLGRLAIHVSDSECGDKGAVPYFLCEDIQQTLREMKSKGIRTTEPKREGESPWFADFFDNVGNRWGVEEM
jgi:predicted enzyme related to lactoylglutathione lyase